MSDVPATDSDGVADNDELLTDFVFLLTPTFDIHRRIEPGEFIAFVANVDRAIDKQFLDMPARDGIEIQVACALLPGRRKITEFQVHPPGSGVIQLEGMREVINGLPVPEMREGPVAFFRRRDKTGKQIRLGFPAIPSHHGAGIARRSALADRGRLFTSTSDVAVEQTHGIFPGRDHASSASPGRGDRSEPEQAVGPSGDHVQRAHCHRPLVAASVGVEVKAIAQSG